MATSVARQEAARTRRQAAIGDPILASKVTAPGVPGWAIQRPRITRLIARGVRRCPLTVITGPPGAGKTMALGLWAAAEPGAVAWVSLDGYDNRPGVFWSYVIAAMRRAGLSLPRTLSATPRGRAPGHVFLLQLASALAAQDPPVVLILDDLHMITEPKVLDGLEFVLRNAGLALRLVVSSRMDPLLRLHRYRLAGELAEIRADALAFDTAEVGALMAQRGSRLSAESIACLTRRTEGWAAGVRLAAISVVTQPDPDRFITDLIAEDSALTGYLVDEVLAAQPPEVRDLLLKTSILEQVSADAARDLTGSEQAAGILENLARANAFVQPIGRDWYRYHTLFAEVLRLKLRREHPDQAPSLRRRAARWYERNGRLTEAVRHAAEIGDWTLASGMVIDALAITEIIEPRCGQPLAEEFADMPSRDAWTEPQPYLVAAAVAYANGRPAAGAAALDTAEAILERLPGDQQAASRLAAAMIRLAAARRSGNLAEATTASARAEALAGRLPGSQIARHPRIGARVLSGRGAVELWAGHFGEAARLLEAGAAAAAAWDDDGERADCLGHLAVVEAMHGRLGRAADLAGRAVAAPAADDHRSAVPHPSAAALVALAGVHLERGELRETRSLLKQADAALGASPDRLIGGLAGLVAAGCALAEGAIPAAGQIVARARSGWAIPAWLEQMLSLVESRACAAAGDIRAALAAAGRADRDDSPEAAVTLAQAWVAAGDGRNARRALEPALGAGSGAPERARLHAWLVDARLSYDAGDRARGRRSLASALRLAEREQVRLPFVLERGWIGPVLRRDPGLADTHRRLFAASLRDGRAAALARVPQQAPPTAIEQLTEREREVLRHVSGMLSTAEVASELYISTNTVKTHLKSIYRKLAATHRGEAVRRARQLNLI